MSKFGVTLELERVRLAREEFKKAQVEFNSAVNALMARLLHDAAIERMSAEEVAKQSGFTVKQIRSMMRDQHLDPRKSQTFLSKAAADNLAHNATLMGLDPKDIDLMSPLAYLPLGDDNA